MDSYLESAKALAYAEQFYAIAKDDAFSTQEGYAIHKIGHPKAETPDNYFSTTYTPMVVSQIFAKMAQADVPVDRAVREMTLRNMMDAHATLCRVAAMPAKGPFTSKSLETAQNYLGSELPQIKTSIEVLAKNLS